MRQTWLCNSLSFCLCLKFLLVSYLFLAGHSRLQEVSCKLVLSSHTIQEFPEPICLVITIPIIQSLEGLLDVIETRLLGSSACSFSSARKGSGGAVIVHMDGLHSFCREGIQHTLPRDLDEAGVWVKSSVQAVEGFIAGHRPVPKMSLLKPLLLLLTSDWPEVVHRHSGSDLCCSFPGIYLWTMYFSLVMFSGSSPAVVSHGKLVPIFSVTTRSSSIRVLLLHIH